MNFTGKNVLITGGSRGIGRAVAMAFAKKGARVAINFRSDQDAAKQTAQEMQGDGHIIIKADISKPSAVEALINAVVHEFGSLDIVVNNAGIYAPHPLASTDYKNWQSTWKKTMDINLFGAANICYCAGQQMIKQGGGRIVNVSSRGAFRGEPCHSAYGASKAALNAMSQSLAQELAPYQIFVGIIAPGFVETDMAKEILDSKAGEDIRQQSPLNRVAKPEEVAYGILFLASEGSEFMTGTILDINGASYLRS